MTPLERSDWAIQVIPLDDSTDPLELFKAEVSTSEPRPTSAPVPAPVSTKPRVSLAELTAAGFRLDGDEALAIGQALCVTFIRTEVMRRVIPHSDASCVSLPVTLREVTIDASGLVSVNSDEPLDVPATIQTVGKILSDIIPANHVLTTTRIIAKALASPPHYHNLDDLSHDLAEHEAPNRNELIQTVYERWEQAAAASARLEPAVPSSAPTPSSWIPAWRPSPGLRSKYRSLAVAGAAALTLVAVLGVGRWWLLTRTHPGKRIVTTVATETVATERAATDAVEINAIGINTVATNIPTETVAAEPAPTPEQPIAEPPHTPFAAITSTATTVAPTVPAHPRPAVPTESTPRAESTKVAAPPTRSPLAPGRLFVAPPTATAAVGSTAVAVRRTPPSTSGPVPTPASPPTHSPEATSVGGASNITQSVDEVALRVASLAVPASSPPTPVEPPTANPLPRPTASLVTYSESDAGVTPPRAVEPQLLAGLRATSPGIRLNALTIAIVVNPDGTVESVKGVNAPQNMGELVLLTTALSVVKSWHFLPATKDGAPVRYRQVVPLRMLAQPAS